MNKTVVGLTTEKKDNIQNKKRHLKMVNGPNKCEHGAFVELLEDLITSFTLLFYQIRFRAADVICSRFCAHWICYKKDWTLTTH